MSSNDHRVPVHDLTPVRIRGKRQSQIARPVADFKRQKIWSPVPLESSSLKKPRWSALERLPVELLEDVFRLCPNLSLPQASPVIGGKLSSRSLRKELLTKLLVNDVSLDPDNQKYHGDSYQSPASRILRFPWLTLSLWQEVRPCRKEEALRSKARPKCFCDMCPYLPAEPKPIGVVLPVRLLRRPWTDENFGLLRHLIDLGIDFHVDTYDGEVAEAVLVEAIEEGNEAVVCSLLCRDL